MYYICDIIKRCNNEILCDCRDNSETLYGVVDTSDNIEEFYTEYEIFDMVKSGLVIEGVSDLGIKSVEDKIIVKHKLANLEYSKPIRLDTNYSLVDNTTYCMLVSNGNIIDINVSVDRLQYLINKGVRLDNIVNCSYCSSCKGDYYIFNNFLYHIRNMISDFIKNVKNVLYEAINLNIVSHADLLTLDDFYIKELLYNYKYDVFILHFESSSIIVKYSTDIRSTYFRLFDKTLGKDIRMRNILYTELCRNSIKSVEFKRNIPKKYCFSVFCDCGALKIL